MELARDDERAGAFRGDEVNVVRPNHDDHIGVVSAFDGVGKFSQLGVDHAVGHGSWYEISLTDKVSDEGRGRHVVHHFQCIQLLQAALMKDSDSIGHGKRFVMIVCDEHGRCLCPP